MQADMSSGRGAGRLLFVAAALLGLLLVPSASASAKTAPELALSIQTVGAPGTALSPSMA